MLDFFKFYATKPVKLICKDIENFLIRQINLAHFL